MIHLKPLVPKTEKTLAIVIRGYDYESDHYQQNDYEVRVKSIDEAKQLLDKIMSLPTDPDPFDRPTITVNDRVDSRFIRDLSRKMGYVNCWLWPSTAKVVEEEVVTNEFEVFYKPA